METRLKSPKRSTNFVSLKKNTSGHLKKHKKSLTHTRSFSSLFFFLKKKNRGQEGCHCPHQHWASQSHQLPMSFSLWPALPRPCRDDLQGTSLRNPYYGFLLQLPREFQPPSACSTISSPGFVSYDDLNHSQLTSFQTYKTQSSHKGYNRTLLTHQG